MTEEEIEAVAEELAKVGGSSWYPGRTDGPLFRAVSERYRDRARVAIAALDRLRARKMEAEALQGPVPDAESADQREASDPEDHIQVGCIVVYRPPGDRRAIPCRVDRLAEGRVYLTRCTEVDVGWVSMDSLVPVEPSPTRAE